MPRTYSAIWQQLPHDRRTHSPQQLPHDDRGTHYPQQLPHDDRATHPKQQLPHDRRTHCPQQLPHDDRATHPPQHLPHDDRATHPPQQLPHDHSIDQQRVAGVPTECCQGAYSVLPRYLPRVAEVPTACCRGAYSVLPRCLQRVAGVPTACCRGANSVLMVSPTSDGHLLHYLQYMLIILGQPSLQISLCCRPDLRCDKRAVPQTCQHENRGCTTREPCHRRAHTRTEAAQQESRATEVLT